ncbi:MAG: DUF2948 family protein [Paracoccaceae bacterium]
MTDAKFEDGAEAPLYLGAQDANDLGVISALVQDAVFPVAEMTFRRAKRQFALLVNRFRWEDRDAADRAARGYERVQSVLMLADVRGVRTSGLDRTDRETVLSLLSVTWEAGPDGTGTVILTLAGDGVIAVDVESLDATLKDVTRPYLAPSHRAPDHKL